MDPTAGAVQILRRTQPWVRLANLVAFLLAGLMAGFGADAVLGALPSERFKTLPFLLLYLPMSVVFFVPGVHLNKYAKRIGLFVAQGHQVQLEAALDAQRKF